jgi:hypothetical protein
MRYCIPYWWTAAPVCCVTTAAVSFTNKWIKLHSKRKQVWEWTSRLFYTGFSFLLRFNHSPVWLLVLRIPVVPVSGRCVRVFCLSGFLEALNRQHTAYGSVGTPILYPPFRKIEIISGVPCAVMPMWFLGGMTDELTSVTVSCFPTNIRLSFAVPFCVCSRHLPQWVRLDRRTRQWRQRTVRNLHGPHCTLKLESYCFWLEQPDTEFRNFADLFEDEDDMSV